MDESSPLTEPRPEPTNSGTATPLDAANGDTKPAAPRSVSGLITSKRVVIPPSAKKSVHLSPTPAPVPVADAPATSIERVPLAKGETPDDVNTLPPADIPANSFGPGHDPVTPPASSTPSAGGPQPGDTPHAPPPANLTPRPVAEPPRERQRVNWILWLGIALLLLVAAIAILLLILPNL